MFVQAAITRHFILPQAVNTRFPTSSTYSMSNAWAIATLHCLLAMRRPYRAVHIFTHKLITFGHARIGNEGRTVFSCQSPLSCSPTAITFFTPRLGVIQRAQAAFM
ncbi:hypothetical protein RvY_06402-2 [Ramazzottius varieornatus]|uniref:Uncharacterized protein n=1 Tax=Ramazzottius varieornatus TaxID=947166 RepID=A0A1D1UYF3_RAMVA|nr:hypothetical protein RvY_06402-2 [Ramazzottius varieornatus]